MKYFSGFCFRNEHPLFEKVLKDFNVATGQFDIVGFSYGAQHAVEYARILAKRRKRIGKIVLLSPAFFQHTSTSFRKMQLRLFRSNEREYISKFLQRCGVSLKPKTSHENMGFIMHGSEKQLKSALEYVYKDVDFLRENDTFVFMGDMDSVVDSRRSFDFFSNYGITLLLRGYNHILSRDGETPQ